jgi:hypothetical protein
MMHRQTAREESPTFPIKNNQNAFLQFYLNFQPATEFSTSSSYRASSPQHQLSITQKSNKTSSKLHHGNTTKRRRGFN